jgi:hypothetical protein
MDESFTKTQTISTLSRRNLRSSAAGKFSPSFGVHRGLIKDPNWPPSEFPEFGAANSRRFRRVEAAFDVVADGVQLPVKGDMSLGGAMFLLNSRIENQVITVLVKGAQAQAEILSTSKRGFAFAHHCRFLDPSEAAAVWQFIALS